MSRANVSSITPVHQNVRESMNVASKGFRSRDFTSATGAQHLRIGSVRHPQVPEPPAEPFRHLVRVDVAIFIPVERMEDIACSFDFTRGQHSHQLELRNRCNPLMQRVRCHVLLRFHEGRHCQGPRSEFLSGWLRQARIRKPWGSGKLWNLSLLKCIQKFCKCHIGVRVSSSGMGTFEKKIEGPLRKHCMEWVAEMCQKSPASPRAQSLIRTYQIKLPNRD